VALFGASATAMGYKAPASVMDGCIHLIQPGGRIFIPRFSKKGWRNNDFSVSLYLPIIFTSVPVRRQIDAAESRLYAAIYLEPGAQRTAWKL